MYLEILQQKYGAALEKQAMEKQALNLAKLLSMARNAGKQDKLYRFASRLKQRNKAIDKVYSSRNAAGVPAREINGTFPNNGLFSPVAQKYTLNDLLDPNWANAWL